jgi:hypothetical protein
MPNTEIEEYLDRLRDMDSLELVPSTELWAPEDASNHIRQLRRNMLVNHWDKRLVSDFVTIAEGLSDKDVPSFTKRIYDVIFGEMV